MRVTNQPLSNRRNQNPAWLFAFFFLLGGVMLYGFLVRPALRVMQARDWVQRPCVIVSSTVGRHSGNKGSTYSVDIVFTYTMGQERFTSTHYGFMGGSSSGYAGKEAIVDQYPAGTRTICFVNPANPSDAVIQRHFTKDMLIGLIPLPFVLIGAGGFVVSMKRGKQPSNPKAWEPAAMRQLDDFGAISAQPIEMKPAAAPLTKLVSMILMAAFWNGIVSVFVTIDIHTWHNQGGNWFLSIFLIPFVLVGAGLIVAVVWTFLALFNPRVHLRLTPGVLKPGNNFAVEWQIPGGSKRLSQLVITLECREEAVYSSGKDGNSTATAVCYTAELLNTEKGDELAAGTLNSRAPAAVMHSLDTGNNRVAWKLRVKAKVPRWPGISDEYPVVMLPARWKVAS